MDGRTGDKRMNYEEEVIQAVKDGFEDEGILIFTPQMEKLLRLIYQAGYRQAKIDALKSELANLET